MMHMFQDYSKEKVSTNTQGTGTYSRNRTGFFIAKLLSGC